MGCLLLRDTAAFPNFPLQIVQILKKAPNLQLYLRSFRKDSTKGSRPITTLAPLGELSSFVRFRNLSEKLKKKERGKKGFTPCFMNCSFLQITNRKCFQ